MKYHVNPATGNAGPCRASVKSCPHGGPADHHDSLDEARQAYEATMTTFVVKQKESPGVQAMRSLIRANGEINELGRRRREARDAGAVAEDLELAYRNAMAARRQLEYDLRALPWDNNDGQPYTDTPIDFVESRWSRARIRKGYENDLDKIGPREEKIYAALDHACEEWLSRLSTAEVKALHSYVTDSQSYAESMAASHGAAATFTDSFKYLHSALEKSPRSATPFVVYAGVSKERVNEVRAAGAAGRIDMNRVQSTSMNPAIVNNFMRPSDYDNEDHTALEIKTDRVASLSLFHLREEMEVLLPPQSYKVVGVDRNVSYAYSDGYTYEPADAVYRLSET